MKKLFVVLLSALIILGVSTQARAEIETSSYTGRNYRELQRFIQVYNNYGNTITENSVVILDMVGSPTPITGTVAVTIHATYTSPSALAIGVADETIASGAIGKICTYGPHLVRTTPVQSGNFYITKGSALGTASAGYTVYPGSGYPYLPTGMVGSAEDLRSQTATTARSAVGVALCEYSTTPASIWWAWINVTPDL
ncbi:MAG: hypothetical protein PHQ22_10415 [Sulfuricurvum sp.]|nr:hypothetical protein [Sulfuricurvum sp.]